MKLVLEFDKDRAYGDVVLRGKRFVYEDYLRVPIITWLHNNIGPLKTKELGEITYGDGWEIAVDWSQNDWQNTRTYVIITKPISNELVTKFWMKFQ